MFLVTAFLELARPPTLFLFPTINIYLLFRQYSSPCSFSGLPPLLSQLYEKTVDFFSPFPPPPTLSCLPERKYPPLRSNVSSVVYMVSSHLKNPTFCAELGAITYAAGASFSSLSPDHSSPGCFSPEIRLDTSQRPFHCRPLT